MSNADEESQAAPEPGCEAEDESIDYADEHMNPLARQGGVAGDDDIGEGVGGGGEPSKASSLDVGPLGF